MACSGPDERCAGAIRVVAVSVAPGVGEVGVGIIRAADHRRFGLEVALSGGWTIILVGAEEIVEENLASGGVVGWVNSRGGCTGIRGIKVVIGEVAVACGLEGGDFGFCGGGSSVTANGSRSTESEACQYADDGDDGEEFDEGEGGHGAERDEGVKGRRRVEKCRFLILDFGLKS